MIVPITWLKEYIDLNESPEEIAEAFTSIGYMLDRPISHVDDTAVLDLEVRQNRSDCLSLVGLARELGAVLKRPVKMPEMVSDLGQSNGTTHIHIPDPDLCYRFQAITLEGISISDSPDWMKARLEAYGIKTINAIVDVTNYVSTELGMPMHAYDADKVVNRTITIRAAENGEQIKLFGGKTVSLIEDDIVHADESGPIGYGGLMGGEEKSVHSDTKNIILEAAVYNNASVRRSSRRSDIRTESSTRLEKFLHPELVEIALKRAVKLIQDLAGGTIVDNTDAYPRHFETKKIQLDLHEVDRLGGITVSGDEAHDILHRLEISIENNGELIEATVPYFRTDLEQEADLVEEIIRIHGYDHIPEKLTSTPPPTYIQSHLYDMEEKARDVMVALGYDEIITDPLTQDQPDAIKLENSLTAEKTALRTNMLRSMASALEHRKKYRSEDIRIFEVGKIYSEENGTYVEQRVMGGITYGPHTYLDVKGDLEMLYHRLGYEFDEDTLMLTVVDDKTVHFEINMDTLVKKGTAYTPVLLSTPPQRIFHDFSVSVSADTHVTELLNSIKNLDARIYSVELGEKPRINGDSKTLYIHVSYYDLKAPLSEDDVRPLREEILEYIQSR